MKMPRRGILETNLIKTAIDFLKGTALMTLAPRDEITPALSTEAESQMEKEKASQKGRKERRAKEKAKMEKRRTKPKLRRKPQLGLLGRNEGVRGRCKKWALAAPIARPCPSRPPKI